MTVLEKEKEIRFMVTRGRALEDGELRVVKRYELSVKRLVVGM